MEGCSCFTDAGSDVYNLSSLVVQNADEVGEAVHLLQRLALDWDGCVVGCVGPEHLALSSVDGEALSFPGSVLGFGDKSQIIAKVKVFQLFPECPLNYIALLPR
ncbi:hypothetical protein DPMN_077106 [Dreissena polymorpha]|uniref:Uncharacterized protein n=1 Tax=Dreissena polymorpha TaxID=45954 RepID=A0A9D3YJV5_DREPO|nr:hypothetical protein DPMN_077106 [Dreissena polymorpha]